MNLEGRDGRRSNTGLVESLNTDNRPPRTAVIRRTETRSIKTNQTTGLKLAEQSTKNQSLIMSVRQQLVTQKECIKMGSARPITSRGQRGRNFHSMRHFQGVLHSKIKDLALEIEKLHWKCNDAQQEYINSITYEYKAKELASEITNLQKTLADLNLTFDFVNRIGDIEEIEKEIRQLEELNISERGRIEGLFGERKLKEDFVHQIDNNEVFKKMINISNSDTKEEKEQYIYLNNRLSQSSRAVEFWNKQIEQYKKTKKMFTKKLKNKLPVVDEIISLEMNLLILKRKWKNANENSTSKLNEEREIILDTVKQDKSEITRMECNIKNLTRQIGELQEVIDELKLPGEDISQTKETIDVYLSCFENDKNNELKCSNSLQSEIIHFLSDLKVKLSWIPTMTDYLNLQDNKIEEVMVDSTDLLEGRRKTFDSSKRLELMVRNTTQECNNIDKKCNELKDDLEEYKSQKRIRDKFEILENELSKQKLKIEEERKNHLEELKLAKVQLEKLEKEVSDNKKHEELLTLEKKHSSLEEDIMSMNETINELKTTTTHLEDIRSKTLNMMDLINLQLMNNYE